VKILIIGNGFDLAHGLPTKYTDFLETTKRFLEFHQSPLLETPAAKRLSDALSQKKMYAEFCEKTKGNIWLDYLSARHKLNLLKGNNWIDFEDEIQSVVSLFEGQRYDKIRIKQDPAEPFLSCQ
jgi:hypothetical protein